MAGNPNWAEDELVLVIDLLQRTRAQVPDTSDPRMVALSERLRALPLHPPESRQADFRSPNSVRLKCFNLLANEPGLYPSGNLVATNRIMWQRYWPDPAAVAARIRGINEAVETLSTPEPDEGDQQGEEEGGLVIRAHRARERSKKLRGKVLAKYARLEGGVSCAGCDRRQSDFARDSAIALAAFEVHHLEPLQHRTQRRKTLLGELVPLCASCHRVIHALMRLQDEPVGLDLLRAAVRSA